MATYRVHLVGDRDEAFGALEIACANDHQALRRMSVHMAPRCTFEVWEGERLVARLTGSHRPHRLYFEQVHGTL